MSRARNEKSGALRSKCLARGPLAPKRPPTSRRGDARRTKSALGLPAEVHKSFGSGGDRSHDTARPCARQLQTQARGESWAWKKAGKTVSGPSRADSLAPLELCLAHRLTRGQGSEKATLGGALLLCRRQMASRNRRHPKEREGWHGASHAESRVRSRRARSFVGRGIGCGGFAINARARRPCAGVRQAEAAH